MKNLFKYFNWYLMLFIIWNHLYPRKQTYFDLSLPFLFFFVYLSRSIFKDWSMFIPVKNKQVYIVYVLISMVLTWLSCSFFFNNIDIDFWMKMFVVTRAFVSSRSLNNVAVALFSLIGDWNRKQFFWFVANFLKLNVRLIENFRSLPTIKTIKPIFWIRRRNIMCKRRLHSLPVW